MIRQRFRLLRRRLLHQPLTVRDLLPQRGHLPLLFIGLPLHLGAGLRQSIRKPPLCRRDRFRGVIQIRFGVLDARVPFSPFIELQSEPTRRRSIPAVKCLGDRIELL